MTKNDRDPKDLKQEADNLMASETKQSEKIVSEVKKEIKLFVDDRGDPFARIKINGHFENWPVAARNRRFRIWIARRGRQILGSAPTEAAIKEAITTFEGEAILGNSKEIKLFNRVAFEQTDADGKFWYDLTSPDWSVIEITALGWKEDKNSPILFRRYQHQLPQALPPQNGNDIRLIDKYLRLKDDKNKVLIYAFLVTALIPDIPHVCLLLHGPQGSSKTTMFKIIRFLVDPSRLEVVNSSTDKRSFILNLEQNWFCPLDNISGLKKDVSDILCQAITGTGFSDRSLYTDDEPFIRAFKRVIGLGGINIAATQPDLLDRCLMIELKPFSKNERKSEAEIWREFKKDLPKIFGGMLDLFVKAIPIRPGVKLKPDQDLRMADFACWGESVSQALGFPPNHLLDVYDQNMKEIINEGILSDPVAETIRLLVEIELSRKKTNNDSINEDTVLIWSGQPSNFIIKLEDIATCNRIITSSKEQYWPGKANAMSRHINRIKPTLEAEGICVETGKRNAAGRWITVIYERSKDSNASGQSLYDKISNNENQENEGSNDSQNSQHDDHDDEIDVEKIPF